MTIAQLTQEKIRVSALVEEHKHCDLEPFDQFVLFMVLFHRGYDGFVDTIARDYQITTGTARRYYDAFMCGLSFFSLHMQPNPTCDEMVNATPAEVSELINASAPQPVVSGNATPLSQVLSQVRERPQQLGGAQEEIIHEPGCMTCTCQACKAFKCTRNKVAFEGADEKYSK